jgi:hypothetical protein
VAYWNQTQLEQLIGQATVLACFDDFNKGAADPGSIALVQELSDAKIDGALATEYPDGKFPIDAPPALVVHASLMYGRYLAYQRRPEYVKMYGEQPFLDAKSEIDRMVNAREYLTDALGSSIAIKPDNVGGVFVDNGPRIIVDNPDGSRNSGDY